MKYLKIYEDYATPKGELSDLFIDIKQELLTLDELREAVKIHGVDVQEDDGWTFLMTSVIAEKWKYFKELIKLGADPNITNNLSFTTLYYASFYGEYDAVKLLIENGADVNAKQNIYPYHSVLVPYSDTPPIIAERDKKTILLLLKAGADITYKNSYLDVFDSWRNGHDFWSKYETQKLICDYQTDNVAYMIKRYLELGFDIDDKIKKEYDYLIDSHEIGLL